MTARDRATDAANDQDASTTRLVLTELGPLIVVFVLLALVTLLLALVTLIYIAERASRSPNPFQSHHGTNALECPTCLLDLSKRSPYEC